MRLIYCVFAVCLAFAASVSPSAAEEDDQAWGVTLDASLSAQHLKMPDYKPIRLAKIPEVSVHGEVTAHDKDADDWVKNLTLVVNTPTPFYLEASGRYFYDQGQTHKDLRASDYSTPATLIAVFAPSGKLAGFGDPHVLVDTKADVFEYGGRLRGGYALDLGSAVTLKPFVGVDVIKIGRAYHVHFDMLGSVTTDDLNEDVDALYRGVTVGLGVQGRWGGFDWGISGSATRYAVRSTYTGSFTYTDPGVETRRDSFDQRGDFYATGLEISADVSRPFGDWTIGVQGSMRSLSAIPEIIASTKGTAGTSVNREPTHLGKLETRSYSLGIKATYTF